MFRSRPVVLSAIALGLCLASSSAHAAAEVHRFNLALSATPTSIDAGDFNDFIDNYNRTVVTPPPRGYDPVEKISFSWLFNSELRYFLTRNLAMNAGVGQLRTKSTKEYLPALAQAINVRAEVISAPVHLGAAYYLAPYNQGDFQARIFLGAGLVHYTHSRTSFQQVLAGTDSATTAQLGGSYKITTTQDGPGYYAEGGVHMFFASRYSVMVSAVYRSGELDGLVDEATGRPVFDPKTGRRASLDIGGIGFKMTAVVGL